MTLDKDDQNGAPGTETITITKIRSGIYRYSVMISQTEVLPPAAQN